MPACRTAKRLKCLGELAHSLLAPLGGHVGNCGRRRGLHHLRLAQGARFVSANATANETAIMDAHERGEEVTSATLRACGKLRPRGQRRTDAHTGGRVTSCSCAELRSQLGRSFKRKASRKNPPKTFGSKSTKATLLTKVKRGSRRGAPFFAAPDQDSSVALQQGGTDEEQRWAHELGQLQRSLGKRRRCAVQRRA